MTPRPQHTPLSHHSSYPSTTTSQSIPSQLPPLETLYRPNLGKQPSIHCLIRRGKHRSITVVQHYKKYHLELPQQPPIPIHHTSTVLSTSNLSYTRRLQQIS